jgi:hypothetical protein
MALELLLAHADGNRPVLRQGLAEETLLGAPFPLPGQMPQRLWDVNQDPNELSKQRWGIIAPEGERWDRILELIAPLMRVREEAQGATALVYRFSAEKERVVDSASAMRWKQETFWHQGGIEAHLPRYLLLLGDLDELPLEVQQVLSTDAFVGRLAFPSEAGYAAYVSKVLRWEERSEREKRARMLFYTAWDGKPAISSAYYGLIDPNVRACRTGQSLGTFPPTAEILELGSRQLALREQLLTQAAELGPGVLFSLSHGATADRDSRRERQGALMLPSEGALLGKDVASRPFLPGGIWFFFACFSAGTPAFSSYEPWLRQLELRDPEVAQSLSSELPQGETPFIAALPQAALANPDGPLAVVGHVDLAWSYGFEDHGHPTPSRFLGVLKALAEGGRAGAALHALQRFVNEASVELTLLQRRREAGTSLPQLPVDPKRWAELWMVRQDLSNYILLGDPAVRLPLDLPRLELRRPGPVPRPDARAVAEQAVLALLAGRSLESVAVHHYISAHELRQWQQLFLAAGRAALDQHFSARR